MTEILPLDTPTGPGRLFVDHAAAPRTTLVLGHGASGGVTSPDLALLAARLPPTGTTVVRVEQPWRTAGGRVAVAPPRLDVGWRAALQALVRSPWVSDRLVVGARSAGARVACRTAPDFDVAAVVCLAFPLHPPGRPDRSRAAELLTPTVPRLVLQGTRDPFGGPAEVAAAVAGTAGVELVALAGADHSFRVLAGADPGPAAVREQIVASVQRFLDDCSAPSRVPAAE